MISICAALIFMPTIVGAPAAPGSRLSKTSRRSRKLTVPSPLTSYRALLVPIASATKPASVLSTVPSELRSYLEAVVVVLVVVVAAVGVAMLLLNTSSPGLPKPLTTFLIPEPSRFALWILPRALRPVEFAP